jgi:ABC-type nickel/cobalt efflux system permease component RcnA
MRRLLVLLVALAALAGPAAAAAHPLGNFTTNRYTRIEVSGNRVYALYVLDLAEIPTYQARGEVRRLGRDGYAETLSRRLRGNLRLAVGGAPRTLEEVRRTLSFPRGAGGLATTRLEVLLDAGRVEGSAAALAYDDRNFPDRIGWREVVVRGSHGADVESSSVPARSVSGELRTYPSRLLSSPLDVSRARARVKPGGGEGPAPATTGGRTAAEAHGFEALVDDDLTAGVVLVSLLVALFWGAAHALTPGHGKAIVAAYLVGTRGKPRHAFALGGIVTVTHTIGVFALGLVTLALSEFIVPEQLYPWLNLVSALLVVGVGVAVLRSRVREWLHRRAHAHGHTHDHHHHHDHGHHHHHGHDHDHAPAPGSGLRGLVAVGISGGLLPCPTALVVLLAAISLHRVGYGLLLIVAFSVGLASIVTGIGLLAVGAKRTFGRMSLDGRVVRALPAASALVIVALGLAMTVRSLPTIA